MSREYGKVAPAFWTGSTGRLLRKFPDAQRIALYLVTGPHANMIGAYYCPPIYIAHEVGCSLEVALEALNKLQQAAFLTRDEETDYVWVHEMARFQIGDALKSADKRVINIVSEFEKLPQGSIRAGFFQRYRAAFHLPVDLSPMQAPSEGSPIAPSKPRAGTGTETRAGTEEEKTRSQPGLLPGIPSKVSRLEPTVGSQVWQAYETEFEKRYSVKPIRNAKNSALCKQVGERLGPEMAVRVATHFISSKNEFYCRRRHDLSLLVRDCEMLRVEILGSPADTGHTGYLKAHEVD